MKYIKKMTSFLLIGCIVIANLYVPKVKAETLAQLRKELEQFEEQYKNNQLEKDLSEKQKQTILNNIDSLNRSIEQASNNIISLNEQIEKLNEEIAKDEEEIQSILVFTQIQNGESAYLEYAFGAQDFTDFIYRIAVSEQLTNYNNELIETNKKNIEENKAKTQELEKKKQEMAQKQKELKVELDKVKLTIQEMDEESESIQDQIDARKSAIKVLEKMECGENEDSNDCLVRYLAKDNTFHRPITVGYVSGWMGYRLHPITKTWRMHWGTDISTNGANSGTIPVYSIGSGVVVATFTSYSSCGGKRIYIMHNINGKIYTSGYWHLNTVLVSVGQTVNANTQIGVIAGRPDPTYGNIDTCSNGGHVHLEISTGRWDNDTYAANRFDARQVISFPKSTYVTWYER